ncbi:hypothetical protein EDB85DRAFT_1891684 [Lactarius pseudohatsudake]|nr:hypothetical protein EDB85DRAFT_1891684 [Lactarius pseudohatsudake]
MPPPPSATSPKPPTAVSSAEAATTDTTTLTTAKANTVSQVGHHARAKGCPTCGAFQPPRLSWAQGDDSPPRPPHRPAPQRAPNATAAARAPDAATVAEGSNSATAAKGSNASAAANFTIMDTPEAAPLVLGKFGSKLIQTQFEPNPNWKFGLGFGIF